MKTVATEVSTIIRKLSITAALISRVAIDSEACDNPIKYPGLMSFSQKERLRQITLMMDRKYPRIFKQNPVWKVRESSDSIRVRT